MPPLLDMMFLGLLLDYALADVLDGHSLFSLPASSPPLLLRHDGQRQKSHGHRHYGAQHTAIDRTIMGAPRLRRQ